MSEDLNPHASQAFTLPKHISEQKVIETIDYRKDVDGFHPINVGRMSIGLPCYVSATPNGILELLKRYKIETSGKKCVVLGRSNIVGKPMAALMMQKAYPGDATVTVCHSRSKALVKECQEADIIIAAMGPTPPGTGVMNEHLGATSSNLTSPVSLKPDFLVASGTRVVPTSMTTAPSFTISAFTKLGCPIAAMKNTLLAGKKAIYQ